MRILVVSVSVPAPAVSGGERRLANVIRGLAPRHTLGIVALRRAEPDPAFLEIFKHVALVDPAKKPRSLPYPLSALRIWWNTLFASVPQFASGSHTPAFRAAVERALEEFAPDAVHVEPADVAHVIPAIKRKGAPVSFGAIEVVTAKSERWMGIVAKRSHRFAGAMELGRTRRLEQEAFRAADVVVCVSEKDRDAVRSFSGKTAVVAENGVDSGYFAPDGSRRDSGRVVMVGPLSYAANLDAMNWFSDEMLPRLARVQLEVIGKAIPVADLPRRKLAGAVEDVRPHLAKAGALVAPLRIGGGTRLKILEALSMETPVVTTTIGAEGLDVRDGEHLLIADEPRAFVAAVERVLRDPDLAGRLGRAGRKLVVERYGWERSISAIESALIGIAGRASRTAT